MQTRIIDLNCKERNFEFNLSVLSGEEWEDIAHQIVLIKGEKVKCLELVGLKVVIRDNVAKFKAYYQDSAYHELEYHFSEFGRASKQYQDITSKIWQKTMFEHYGERYNNALEAKLNEVTTNV